MKSTPLKRNTGLKSYSSLRSITGLKRSTFIKKEELTPRQELDWIISKFVRLSAANPAGFVKCITCYRYFYWKKIQCGHFQKREHTATRYDLRNLGPQCETCNCFNDGENDKFAEYIDSVHGANTSDMLIIQASQTIYNFPYEEQILLWSEKLKELVEHRENQIQY